MHARVITLRPKDGQKERVLRICEDVVTPTAERQKGFCGLLISSNPETDIILSISIWDTESDMLATERGDYLREQIGHVIHFLVRPPVIEHHVVDVMS